jgi:hypothetical protein
LGQRFVFFFLQGCFLVPLLKLNKSCLLKKGSTI